MPLAKEDLQTLQARWKHSMLPTDVSADTSDAPIEVHLLSAPEAMGTESTQGLHWGKWLPAKHLHPGDAHVPPATSELGILRIPLLPLREACRASRGEEIRARKPRVPKEQSTLLAPSNSSRGVIRDRHKLGNRGVRMKLRFIPEEHLRVSFRG
eukprot:5755785-Amphidinium_carterae.3